MLSEIVSFVVFAVSIIGLLGFLAVIMTSSPVYRPQPEKIKKNPSERRRRAK